MVARYVFVDSECCWFCFALDLALSPVLSLVFCLVVAAAHSFVSMVLALFPSCSCARIGVIGTVKDSTCSRSCVNALDAEVSCTCARIGDEGIVKDSKCSRSCVNGLDADASCTCARSVDDGGVNDSKRFRKCVNLLNADASCTWLEVV